MLFFKFFKIMVINVEGMLCLGVIVKDIIFVVIVKIGIGGG